MRQAAIGVPVATVWSFPEAPSAADAPAVAPAPDVPGWAGSLSHEQKLSLVGRVVTQALWGDPALVLAERGGWAQVILPGQPSSLDPRGYPGWIPAAHLAPWVPGHSAERYMVTERAVRADVASAGPAWVSFGTAVHVPAPAGETPAGDDHVWAATGSGHRLRLPAAALASLPDGAGRGGVIVACALGFTGLPYLWGGVSGFGFDCSGLVWAVHRRYGITTPRDAGDQAESGQPASLRALEPGDLVFFAERRSGRVHHVGLALGDGRMVHSPRTGRSVEVTPLTAQPYASELATARRYHAGSLFLRAAVGSRTMLDVLDNYGMLRFVDPVQDAPLRGQACTVEASQRGPERLADPVRRLQEWAGDEFDGRAGHVLREQFADRAPGRTGQPELVRPRAHRLRSASSARTASAP